MTEVGILPSDWEVEYLDNVAERKSGHTPDKKVESYWNGNIPWISLKDLSRLNKRFVSETTDYTTSEGIKNSSAVLLPMGTIVISRDATVGKIGILSKEMATSQHFINYICSSRLNNIYLYYYLLFKNHIFERIATGSTIKTIGLGFFKKLKVALPPINEQQKIASILSTWDKVIELKEKLIEQKKVQKKGLMQKLLTGEVRLPGFDGEWKKVKLAKVVKKTKGKAVEYLEGGKFPAIDMDYLESGKFKNYSNDATVFAEKNDVLLLWDGSRAGMAFTGVEGAVGSTFVKLECKSIHNIFLQKHLEMNEQKIQRLREGSGIPHVPKDFLDYYKVKMPSMEEQKAIAYVLNSMDRDLDLLLKEVTYLKKQKQGLMQLLLTGKVRVKV